MFNRLKSLKPFQQILLFALLAIILFVLYVFYDLPSLDSLSQNLNHPSIKITDRDGHLLYDILPSEGGRQATLSFENIPQCMKDATIAVEDKNFYQNSGVDLQGILRALWIDIQGGETIAGGSTITQQVARTLLLSQDERTQRTLRRKLRETVLAWELTHKYSKDEILALYLNQIYYGGMAYGVEAASQTYFGKPASQLLLPECALLAGLPQTPGLYNPFTNPDLALERQRVVLGLMEKNGYITHAQLLEAQDMPLSYNSTPYPIVAPHFIWLIKDQLDALFLNGTLNSNQSLVVRTTLDLNMQHIAENTIALRLSLFKPKEGEISHNVNNAALLALDPHTGEILAMVGSANYFDSSIDGALNMTTSARQSGSAFKPIIYAAALDPNLQHPLTAGATLLDVSTTFTTKDGAPYVPVNYDGKEHGYVSVREALASSLNVPAVLTLQHIGIDHALELAHKLGITSISAPQDYDLSLALGGGEMSLLELSSAFQALANEGRYINHSSILEIRDADGNLIYKPERSSPVQAIDPRVAWLVTDILSDDAARVTGFGSNSILQLGRVAAVKTGTTTNFHDNWTIGYTPDLLIGVWAGNSNHEAMHNVSGLTGAAPIWHEVMHDILQGEPDKPFLRPEGLTQIEICDLSGLLPTPACPHTKKEWFIDGTQPTVTDSFYEKIQIDTWTNALALDSTPIDRRKSITVLDLPVQAQSWARAQGLPLLGDYSVLNVSTNGLTLISPQNNATYRIDPTFDLSAQKVSVEAIGQGFKQVTLYIDGTLLAEFSSTPYQSWWGLAEGVHHFWAEAITMNGETIKSEEIMIQVVK